MARANWGDKVSFTHKMVRVHGSPRSRGFSGSRAHPVGNRKTWTSMDSPGVGIYLGPRVKQNGVVHYSDNWEESAWFEPDDYVTVALVSTGPRSAPVHVDMEGMEVLERCAGK